MHIAAFCRGLADGFGAVDLLTPPADPMDVARFDDARVRHFPVAADGEHLIKRVQQFRRGVIDWFRSRHSEVIQFRSIYEGYPIACDRNRFGNQLVFEVNGLPSIELKYSYPDVAEDRELLRKIAAQEDRCLREANLVVTVSQVNARYLVQRGVSPSRLRVIPNGVDCELFDWHRPRPVSPVDRPIRLLYVGTLSAWQGIDTAVCALKILRQQIPAELTIVGPARPRQKRQLEEFCGELGVTDAVHRLPSVSQQELAALYRRHDFCVAPLKDNDRNTLQGCCPLKVLEAMSAGTPLIASDLPIVRELVRDGCEALLVPPGSAGAIAEAVLRLTADQQLAISISEGARRRVVSQFTWKSAQNQLIRAYADVLGIFPSGASGISGAHEF